MNEINAYNFYEVPEYHAVFSIQLCELINDGWIDFDDESWNFDCYDEEQRDRFWLKFKRHYYWREIGITPPSEWKWELLRKLDEVMPKYKPIYKALEEGQNIFQHYGEYGKSRTINSDFPQTMLGGNEDYASNGSDKEHEEIYLGDWFEQMQKIKTYDDVDVMLLKELETMFSACFFVSVNGY